MNAGWRLREYASVPSTSDLCVSLAQAGEPGGLAVLARQQTGARGSRGRAWQTLPGNLALSVLLRPGGPSASAGHWALLAAVVLAEALEACGAPPLRLKWPNDVLMDGRKLGGVLLDTGSDSGFLTWLVIGFGANLATAPDLPGVSHLPCAPKPSEVAGAVRERLGFWERVVARHGFAPVRRAWLARGPEPGTGLRVTVGARQSAGEFAGLSESGALLLRSGRSLAAFSTGDVLQGA